MSALSIRNLSKTYRGKKFQKVAALKDLTLEIAPGEIFGFLGPNGAGKSTTIKTLMGLIAPTGGAAFITGIPVSDPSARKHVGYLPENPSFPDLLTAREYLIFTGRMFGMNDQLLKRKTDEVLALLELTAAADRPIRGYSKGMVQRLGLAQTLLHDPEIYILDEPMSGLDPLGRALVKDIIRDLKVKGKTVFFSTHITADVEVVCDRVGIIYGGTLRVVDQVEKLLVSGVEGYVVQGRGQWMEFPPEYAAQAKEHDVWEVLVPKERIGEFMKIASQHDLTVTLIEPRRKNLEAFFLDVVAGS